MTFQNIKNSKDGKRSEKNKNKNRRYIKGGREEKL